MTVPPYDVVVLDTTALWPSPLLDGVHFKVLFAGLKFATKGLAVPQVVLDEAARHFAERCQEAAAKFEKAQRELRALGIKVAADFSLSPPVYPFTAAKAWPVAITVLPYPDVAHAEIVRRDLQRRKPFDASGKGYRDALTWHCILEVAKTAAKIAFITNNTNDFAQGRDGTIHPDLARDLPSGVAVDLYPTLESFNAAHVQPHLHTVDDMRRALDAGAYPSFDLSAWARDRVGDLVPHPPLLRVLHRPDGEPWTLDEVRVDEPVVRVTNAQFLGENQYLLELELESRVHARLRNQAAWDVVAGELYFGPEHIDKAGTVVAIVRAMFDTKNICVTNAATVRLKGPQGEVALAS